MAALIIIPMGSAHPTTDFQLLIPVWQFWEEDCHPRGSVGDLGHLEGSSWFFEPSLSPPAVLPEAAASGVNLQQFKESLSGSGG